MIASETPIPFDFESASLELKTNSITGEKDMVAIGLLDEDGNHMSVNLKIRFKDPITFTLNSCLKLMEFPDIGGADKVWQIFKRTSELIVLCNDVLMTRVVFANVSHFSDYVNAEQVRTDRIRKYWSVIG